MSPLIRSDRGRRSGRVRLLPPPPVSELSWTRISLPDGQQISRNSARQSGHRTSPLASVTLAHCSRQAVWNMCEQVLGRPTVSAPPSLGSTSASRHTPQHASCSSSSTSSSNSSVFPAAAAAPASSAATLAILAGGGDALRAAAPSFCCSSSPSIPPSSSSSDTTMTALGRLRMRRSGDPLGEISSGDATAAPPSAFASSLMCR
mmetsp:Transcript_39172/g.122540  ORF Transcript_39172/g.122540 Transcript_39172/m.122540 type:complete len:204 (+) Transcript_39172:359-970(+)